jgi:IS30 family transposase
LIGGSWINWEVAMTRRFSEAERAEIWDALERGESMRAIARNMGRAHASIRTWVLDNAGRRPRPPGSSDLRLTLAEREEISRGLARGQSLRAIAAGMNRSPSTVCREVAANGGRRQYRALTAERAARRRARRPKVARLAALPRLRAVVEARLADYWSPEEISAWLARAYPDNAEMRVSHETIYMSLFVQGRGALRQELHRCLRSGRALRRPKARTKGGFGQGQITNKVMISERPAEVADRAVPGHWEGDLIYGRRMTCIGTLVERSTRYVMLFPLPNGHTAEAVRVALAKKIRHLPTELRRSLTWDQGHEMAEHARFTIDTGVQVYFCDPKSPWQRGSNENTNGLLRQYLPKTTDLSKVSTAELNAIARSLNGRPRQTLEWRSPSEAFNEAVAMTA